WAGTSTTVARGLRLIAEGALDHGGVEALGDRLGVTSRHLSRLFLQYLGASPRSIAQTRRLHFAKKLLDETDLAMTDIALSAGYGSVRRFNDHFRQVYGRSPSQLRQLGHRTASSGFCINLRYRPPYDYAGVLEFLAARSIPGVELIEQDTYSRNILIDGEAGSLHITNDADRHQLRCEITMLSSRLLMPIVGRVRRMFDLDADPMEIACGLGADPALAAMVASNPGRRIPGAWDAFEVTIRAIVGQQVSVKGATTVMGRIAASYGETVDGRLMFPDPARLARLEPTELPMPQTRARAISTLAAAVTAGDLQLSAPGVGDKLIDQLTAIKGIGPWTAQYVAMRALSDPDAFLHNDLVLLKVARHTLGIESSKELQVRAENWRPWRAYAGMHLWAQAAELKEKS
ncbi:MAG TPA: AlkA N-terminal domain-containing protein, partial [Pseudomonadales bacterium]|nr:AlkA N-terminal domain-containing protein [Pseudomonadales bacterium]